ncbi:MAG: transcription-repair coupling factor, partial [Pseudomonadota bacterium]|nr:transcription-repair coupling factor [Pseudomonadota bacterium]
LDDTPFGASVCEVDLGSAALIPDDYIPDVHTRLTLYKRLAEASEHTELQELKVEMIDRFGLLPQPVERMFEAAELRTQAQQLGLSRVRAGSRSITLDFGAQPKVNTARLIRLIQQQPKIYKLEGQSRLHCYGEFDVIEKRAQTAAQLLDTLQIKEAAREA